MTEDQFSLPMITSRVSHELVKGRSIECSSATVSETIETTDKLEGEVRASPYHISQSFIKVRDFL